MRLHTAVGVALALLLPAAAPPSSTAAPVMSARPTQLVAGWTPPLSTRGRYVVDANGNRFRLKSGSWHGASGTWNGSGDPADNANHHAGENSNRMPLGLDRAPIADIVAGFAELGLNSIRLQFSNELIHDTTPVPAPAVAANPTLAGKTPLEVYDAVVQQLTAAGFAVILNNHTNTTRWCCGLDGNERWNASQSTATWESDWLFMVNRYKTNPRVVGADLYNEVRRDLLVDPNWGAGDEHDWFAASQHLGDRILTEANPNLLIVVEGINWTGVPADGLPHDRPTLTPARYLSHTLVASDKLVYSAHFYGYTGPRHSGATGTGETHDPRYEDLSPEELISELNRQAFFVTGEEGHFTAPLWISEFGVGGREETGEKPRAWFEHFVDQLIRTDADFAYWPLVGWHNTSGADNGWALLAWTTTGQRIGLYDGDDWRASAWTRLMNAPTRTGPVAVGTVWKMLSPDHGDFVESLRMRSAGDWDVGARKGACPDDLRLIGLSHTGNRGLCRSGGPTPSGAYEVVRDERNVSSDWASGYTKYQCAPNFYLTGYSVRGARVSSALCTATSQSLGNAGRTLWFDRGDNRGGAGGDFANGNYKGQCADDEYVAGIAFTTRVGATGTPDALYCRKLMS
ncbi:cellulase family glycosylhydrolase [Kribbella sp. NPDC026611]|uniref:glycoside hydrolase family 5 protein n=1 Tax=Kribbella sp. NPDC026611 TaxID=3154911 RepID=UPI0033F0510F